MRARIEVTCVGRNSEFLGNFLVLERSREAHVCALVSALFIAGYMMTSQRIHNAMTRCHDPRIDLVPWRPSTATTTKV